MNDLTGKLLIAIPNTAHTPYVRSVMLVTTHWPAGGSMVMINKPSRNGHTVGHVMRNSGMDTDSKAPLFFGGPNEVGKIQIIHSLDWQCDGTRELSKDIGITEELSILSAIAGDEGPKYFRCLSGMRLTGPGELEGEMSGQTPWIPQHRWLVVEATNENVFRSFGDEQWLANIAEAGKAEIANWF